MNGTKRFAITTLNEFMDSKPTESSRAHVLLRQTKNRLYLVLLNIKGEPKQKGNKN